MRALRIHASLGVLGSALVLACPTRESEQPEPASTCGPTGERFATYNWTPADARLLLVLRRDDPELQQALPHLRTLARHADAAGLPIRSGLALDNAGLQLGVVTSMLAPLGLEPGELVELHGPDGDIAWLWSSSCPIELAAARMLQRWNVMLRADLDARIGLGDPERFPFDVLVLPDQRMALTSAGAGPRVLAWLRGAEGSEGPGLTLGELAPAPIRAVWQGPALIAGADSNTPAPALPHVRTLRVTGEGVELDGSVWTPP